MNFDGIALVGRVTRSHGVRGELKVVLETEYPEIFSEVTTVYLIRKDIKKTYTLETARSANKFWLFKLKELNDRNTADELRDYGVYVDEKYLVPLADDEFFVHDVYGSNVYSSDGQYLGVITDYFETGAQDVCEVTQGTEKFLFPTTEEILVEVVPEENKVVINLIPGLRELNQ